MLDKPAGPVRAVLLLALTTLTSATPLSAQPSAALPAAPVPVAPALSPPPVELAAPTPLGYVPPPAVVVPPLVAPAYDPGADGWGSCGQCSACPGWFVTDELAIVFPGLKFQLMNDTPLPQTGLQLHVPSVDLDTTFMPTLEVGYRLPDSAGLFALSYSYLSADGTGRQSTLGGDADVRTRVRVNWLDFDYGTAPYEFAPRYQLSWRIGARMVDVDFESRASNSTLTQTACNDFFGAGPHARLDLERRIVPLPGLSLFGRLDGVVFVGRIKQNFTADLSNGVSDRLSVRRTQTVPYVNLQAGVSYAPPALPGLKLTTGYLFEDYFNSGRLGISSTGEVSGSRGELWSHGWFLRAQYDF